MGSERKIEPFGPIHSRAFLDRVDARLGLVEQRDIQGAAKPPIARVAGLADPVAKKSRTVRSAATHDATRARAGDADVEETAFAFD